MVDHGFLLVAKHEFFFTPYNRLLNGSQVVWLRGFDELIQDDDDQIPTMWAPRSDEAKLGYKSHEYYSYKYHKP